MWLVLDYDAAIAFYTRKLGFELIEDKSFSENRWPTIALPNDRDLTSRARTRQDPRGPGAPRESRPGVTPSSRSTHQTVSPIMRGMGKRSSG